MKLQTEVYISIDNDNFFKIDLAKNESINMKYVLKDTTDLSKVFSPFSLSFTFPGTLNNQNIFGFVGNTKVFKTKTDNLFACKIYSNGLLAQTGKLKLTEVREENGFVKSFTANFTTTMLSLALRMGEDLINDLPTTPVRINWIPNEVFQSISSIRLANTQPMTGIDVKYYVPLISNIRIFQRQQVTTTNYLDNVRYLAASDPSSAKVLKSEEFSPAVQARTIIDMMKIKYGLDIEMPLENTQEYNDWFIWCNSAKAQATDFIYFDLIKPFGSSIEYDYQRPDRIPNERKYNITGNLSTNQMTITKDPASSGNFYDHLNLRLTFNNIVSTKGESDVDVIFAVELSNGAIFNQITSKVENGTVTADFLIKDTDFLSGTFIFKVKVKPTSPILWTSSDIGIYNGYYDHNAGGGSTRSAWASYKQESLGNNNSSTMGGTRIDLYKSLPDMKCTDFLASFVKMFNISIFDASPSNDKLFWLTPNDLLIANKSYSKKEVDYTDFIISKSVTKTIAADYNYYNFKHKTSKYKSNADYLAARGIEFGQTTYPTIKPTQDLLEFKVETAFSILEALPIAGMVDELTSYGFTDETPETLVTGEKRYKPNTEDFTIFFACGLRNLTGDKTLGFQKTNISNIVVTGELKSYIKTSPVHPLGTSFGFSLIQEATVRSLYYDFYKRQTERLLNPNTLKQLYKLRLPASELVLNYKTTQAGMSQVPDGFRLQNEIVLQEQRFSIIDAQIDITTGEASMNLLNF
jgi:hypothetical protein